MPARNGAESFGWVSRVFHWTMAALIVGMLAFGTYIGHMQPSLSNLWLYGLHKSIGLSLLTLTLFRLLWHRLSPPPDSLTQGIPRWQMRASSAVHMLLYVLMISIPLSGWIASSATGLDVVFFGEVTVPPIAPTSEAWENTFFFLHHVLTRLLMACLVLHIAGALHRHLVRKDTTLRRMLRG
jgi:cytochrome b561